MVFLELAELIVAILIFVLFVTQVIIPIWKGENLFPLFRKKIAKVEKEMAQVKEDIFQTELRLRMKEMYRKKKSLQEEVQKEEGEKE